MYIARDKGIIVGVYTQKQAHTHERLSEDNAEVIAFLSSLGASETEKENKTKIEKRMRTLAIDSLKGDGGLPPDYEDRIQSR